MNLPGNYLPLILAGLLLALLAMPGCAPGLLAPDPHWSSNPYGAKAFFEDRARQGGGSAD